MQVSRVHLQEQVGPRPKMRRSQTAVLIQAALEATTEAVALAHLRLVMVMPAGLAMVGMAVVVVVAGAVLVVVAMATPTALEVVAV